jgi:rubrerythrin
MINLKNIQTEVDASFLYAVLAEKEKDNTIASIYKEMSDIECSHAIAFLEKNGMSKSQYPQPSFRAKLIKTLGGWFGADFILGYFVEY